MSFLQIKASMSLPGEDPPGLLELVGDGFRPAGEAIVGADNLYSLLQVFRREHVIAKSGAGSICSQDLTALSWTPISYIINMAASPTLKLQHFSLARWTIAGRWYSAYPAIRD
jgi:hypothetical protein